MSCTVLNNSDEDCLLIPNKTPRNVCGSHFEKKFEDQDLSPKGVLKNCCSGKFAKNEEIRKNLTA